MNRRAALRDAIAAARYSGRPCDECRKPTRTISSLCLLHLRRRGLYGSVKATGHLSTKEWRPLMPDVRRYLARHTERKRVKVPGVPRSDGHGTKQRVMVHVAPPEVLESLTSLLHPGSRLPNYAQRPSNKAWILQRELLRLSDHESRKHSIGHPRHVKRSYRPKEILAHMLAVAVVVEERPEMFPEEFAEYSIVHALLSMWQGRDHTSGRVSIYRGMVDRLRKSRVNVWLLQHARLFLQEQAEERQKRGLTPRDVEPTPESHPEMFVAVPVRTFTTVQGFKVWTGKTETHYRLKEVVPHDTRHEEKRRRDQERAARARAGKKASRTARHE